MARAYSRLVIEELARLPLTTPEALWAELLGMRVGQASGETWILGSPTVARRAYRIAKELELGFEVSHQRGDRRVSYHFHWQSAAVRQMEAANVSLRQAGAFLRGGFLTRGYMQDPERGLRLEFATNSDHLDTLLRMLREVRVRAGSVPHHGRLTVYINGHEAIVNLLAAMGGHQALLHLESVRVMRSVRNQVNRLVNSETANLVRTVESGVQQAQILADFSRGPLWPQLSEAMQTLVRLRIAHPEWSLRELGAALNPPLSKSAVNHRMRRLLHMARGIRA